LNQNFKILSDKYLFASTGSFFLFSRYSLIKTKNLHTNTSKNWNKLEAHLYHSTDQVIHACTSSNKFEVFEKTYFIHIPIAKPSKSYEVSQHGFLIHTNNENDNLMTFYIYCFILHLFLVSEKNYLFIFPCGHVLKTCLAVAKTSNLFEDVHAWITWSVEWYRWASSLFQFLLVFVCRFFYSIS
jgi:hypothetical protein